jgi:membrane-bound ClpP family serine protease
MVCIHPIIAPFDTLIRDHLDDIKNKRSSLLVILETEGGSIETTERIADLFRHSYRGEVSFLIPNFAMSAGTILVMSGDRIFMDYFSIIGPIDPQMVHPQTGGLVPALGYLEKYAELIQKSKRGGLSQAELAFLLDKFDPAQLHRLEQAREHSVDLLKRWLAKYKFKNWDRTRTRNRRVTTKMKTDRAAEVANKLNNTRLWRSHGRGLSIEVVRNDLDLIVEDFGTEPALKDLNVKVRSYYRLLQDYMEKRGQEYVIHTRDTLFAL